MEEETEEGERPAPQFQPTSPRVQPGSPRTHLGKRRARVLGGPQLSAAWGRIARCCPRERGADGQEEASPALQRPDSIALPRGQREGQAAATGQHTALRREAEAEEGWRKTGKERQGQRCRQRWGEPPEAGRGGQV